MEVVRIPDAESLSQNSLIKDVIIVVALAVPDPNVLLVIEVPDDQKRELQTLRNGDLERVVVFRVEEDLEHLGAFVGGELVVDQFGEIGGVFDLAVLEECEVLVGELDFLEIVVEDLHFCESDEVARPPIGNQVDDDFVVLRLQLNRVILVVLFFEGLIKLALERVLQTVFDRLFALNEGLLVFSVIELLHLSQGNPLFLEFQFGDVIADGIAIHLLVRVSIMYINLLQLKLTVHLQDERILFLLLGMRLVAEGLFVTKPSLRFRPDDFALGGIFASPRISVKVESVGQEALLLGVPQLVHVFDHEVEAFGEGLGGLLLGLALFVQHKLFYFRVGHEGLPANDLHLLHFMLKVIFGEVVGEFVFALFFVLMLMGKFFLHYNFSEITKCFNLIIFFLSTSESD